MSQRFDTLAAPSALVPATPCIFMCEGECTDVYEASRAAVEYAEAEQIALVAFMERGARPMRVGFEEYWQLTHPEGDGEPLLCLVNPKAACKSRVFDQCISAVSCETESETAVVQCKERPVMIVDTCVHTGRSIRPVLRAMKQSGFADVRFGVVNGDPACNWSGIAPDVVMLDHIPEKGCYPFGKDFMTLPTGLPREPEANTITQVDDCAEILCGEIRQIIHRGQARLRNG